MIPRAAINDTCLSGQEADRLSPSAECNAGFYCPSNDEAHPPEYCPPTPDCQITRLLEGWNVCQRPQGTFEPIVCPPGFFCPDGGKQIIPCPSGYYCPVGSVAPITCMTLSRCPEGSYYERPLLGFLLCGLFDFVLLAIWLWRTPRSKGFKDWIRPKADPEGLEAQEIEAGSAGSNTDRAVDPSKNEDESYNTQFPSLYPGGLSNDFSMELSFEDLGLRLKGSNRDIVSGLHGQSQSGSVLGVMGPSGSGKSTFVNLLGGQIQATSGCIRLNGHVVDSADLRHSIGFVTQDNFILPELTVRENVLHSARVRLGGQLHDQEIQQYVDRLISSLGLEHVRNQLVGSVAKRGLSGGECKRVSIAIELAAAPRALILDEPTSGLDATAALYLITLLNSISRRGIMVICVVHQPRAEIFALLDTLLLLNHGKQVYFGNGAQCQRSLERRGHRFPTASNAADSIMDLLQTDALAGDDTNEGPKNGNPEVSESTSSDITLLQKHPSSILREMKQRRAGWCRQVWLSCLRGITQQERQPLGICLEILSGAVIGLMIGLGGQENKGHLFQGIYHPPFDLLSSATNYLEIPYQALFCCLGIACAAGPPGVKLFSEERLIFRRESQSGHSRSAYFLGKSVSALPRILLASLHYAAFYLVLCTPAISFRQQLVIDFMYFYCMYGLGCIAAAILPNGDAPLICMVVSVIISSLGGCAPRLAQVREWNLVWFWYMWPATWFLEAFFNENTSGLAYLYQVEKAAAYTGYTTGRTGFDIGLMFLIGTVYRLISYVAFVFIGWK